MNNIKSKTIDKLKEDLIDMKIADEFWKNVKNNKIKLIRKSSDEFLKTIFK